MSDATNNIDLPGPGHIVDPPIVDFLTHDDDLHAYVAEFVPDPQVSSELKESVIIRDTRNSSRRVGDLLDELKRSLGLAHPITKVAHAGGGDYDFYDDRGNAHVLSLTSASGDQSMEVIAILQVLSHEIELEFILQRHEASRAAG